MLIVLVLALLGGLLVAVNAQDDMKPKLRAYQPPDSDYRFNYPLESYSVRLGCTCAAPNGGTDIVFPGVITIDPNDSLVYADKAGRAFRISIATVAAPEGAKLSPVLLGKGPLMQYETDLLKDKTVQSIKLGGVDALRVDNVPTGPAGSLTDILLLHEGLLYQILVEPVGDGTGDDTPGRKLAEDVLKSFQFIPR
jgi:hypothetical protein